ncbi:putative kinase protein [Coprinopsis marcescibilis]|uniref:Putative kinase protein n=1 Tax=Coprinopsis marcescibilis TaxID=230819 RepID=A0A5C3LE07_COPMA|nr:putative kinase protein [Coprinopsis marcescibilis]
MFSATRSLSARRLLCLSIPVVVVGAGALAFRVHRHSHPSHSDILRSPALIPCRALNPLILSPSEHHLSIKSRILVLLRDNVWEPIRTAARFLRLFCLFVPVIFTSPMLLVGRPQKRCKGDRWGAVWWYGYLVQQMEAAGPTFIKLAQWAASRVDLFPPLLCERLGALHSQGRHHPLSHTKKVIEAVFQRPFHEVFEEFDEIPIGSGAIAQVYRAILKHDLIPPSYRGPRRARKVGGPIGPIILEDPPPAAPTASVAIKILHPRVEKTISRDLAIMHFFASCLSLLPGIKWLSLPEEVLVFGEMMHQQLDLRHEADNLLTFESNFSPRKVPVTFPRPLKIWSTKEMLVEEYQTALPLEAFLRNGGGPYDYQVATVGLNAFLNMLLLDNFVHSDLHPGNIMIKFSKPPTTRILLRNLYNHFFPARPSSDSSSESLSASLMVPADYSESDAIVAKLRSLSHSPEAWNTELLSLHSSGYVPELVFIDAGLVTTLNETNRQNFLDLFKAVAEFDGYKTGQLMIERSKTPELATDKETFALKMQHLILSVKRRTFSLGQIKIADLLKEVLRNVRTHHVKMEGDFINTVISILLLEGIGRQLDPNMDLFSSSLPILRQLGGQMAMETKGEGIRAMDLPRSNLAALLKVWVWIEARSFITGALMNVDELVQRDWLTPNI